MDVGRDAVVGATDALGDGPKLTASGLAVGDDVGVSTRPGTGPHATKTTARNDARALILLG
jgi:hypothetical protein